MAFDQSAFDNFQTGIVDGLENLDRELQALATEIVTEMRQMAPKDTGDLQKSIKFQLDRYSFRLEMLNYGAIQNYGVSGTSGGAEEPFRTDSNFTGEVKQPFGISDPIENGNFQFRNRKFGIPSRQFYDVKDILEQMVQEILEIEI